MEKSDVFLNETMALTFEQQDKTIRKQLKVIKKLQKRVREEQRRKNQLASQLQRTFQQVEELKKVVKH
ncbi:hypothetical protein ACWOC1_04655 [Enterococcus quebecensis]|nr:hypothetical protein [Enterococcus quebecensis]OJG75463.1 hypothetical protein RV12_GL001266 [Enterococcus quebecensis]